MSGTTNIDRKSRRRQETTDEIVDAAWALVRERGLGGLSLRDLGAQVGMKAQSLYSYFSSKDEIYDAMFASGYRDALAAYEPLTAAFESGADRFDTLFRGSRLFVEFCTSDPVRYQLLFQRTIPGFEPSPESYALAVEFLMLGRRVFAACGFEDERSADLYTAVLTGITDQQISNDPGGDRWLRLLDEALEMLLDHLAPNWREQSKQT